MCGSALAQKFPMFDDEDDLLLSAQFKVASDVAIAGRPTSVSIPLIWRGERLLHGRLHTTVYTRSPIVKLVSPELTLDQVPRQLEMMLPAIPLEPGIRGSYVDLEFREKGNSEPFNLETHSFQIAPAYQLFPHPQSLHLSVPSYGHHKSGIATTYNIAVFHSSFGTNEIIPDEERLWWSDFAPSIHSRETFSAQENSESFDLPSIAYAADIALEELPTVPYSYLKGFDVVCLQEGIVDLNERQLEALARWIRLGGKLILATSDELGESDKLRSFYQRCHCPIIPQFPLVKPILTRCDLGKVLCLPPNYEATKEIVDQVNFSPADSKFRNHLTLYDHEHTRLTHRLWRSEASITPRTSLGLLELLAPSALSVFPVKTILICLGIFLLAAAPLDYYYLGVIRRRNLTWIVYPTAALLSSGWVINATSSRFSGDANGRWQIVTLGADSTPLQSETFELEFRNEHADVTFHGKNSFYSPFHASLSGRDYMEMSKEMSDWTITGNYPANYTSSARLAKLTPAFSHQTQPYPTLEIPPFLWSEVDPWKIDSDSTAATLSEEIMSGASQLTTEGQKVHTCTMLRNGSVAFSGEPSVTIPSLQLSPEHAFVSFTIQDGNRFTTYVKLYLKPSTPEAN